MKDEETRRLRDVETENWFSGLRFLVRLSEKSGGPLPCPAALTGYSTTSLTQNVAGVAPRSTWCSGQKLGNTSICKGCSSVAGPAHRFENAEIPANIGLARAVRPPGTAQTCMKPA